VLEVDPGAGAPGVPALAWVPVEAPLLPGLGGAPAGGVDVPTFPGRPASPGAPIALVAPAGVASPLELLTWSIEVW
jgi:hypothetical protein